MMNKMIRVALSMLLAGTLISGGAFAASADEIFVNDGGVDLSILSEVTDIDPSTVTITPATAATLEGIMEELSITPSDPTLYAKIAELYNQSNSAGFKVFSEGTMIDFSKYDNVMPDIIGGRTLIPVRALAESLGAAVAFDDATREIKITMNGKIIVLKLDSVKASVDGVAKTLEVPASVVNGRTMIPLRFVGEAFGKNVGWYPSGEAKVISITD